MTYNCRDCPRTFENKRSFSNHTRYGCASIREDSKYACCPNPENNTRCKGKYRHSKTGLCKSCSALKSNVNHLRIGKTYVELFGEAQATKMIALASHNKREWNKNNIGIFSKEKNPNFGKSPWMKGLSLEQIHGIEKAVRIRKAIGEANTGEKCFFYGKNKSGTDNAFIQYKIKELGITEQEYEQLRGNWRVYRREVLRITREQQTYTLENQDKRGKTGIEGAYHLDHAISIKYGFANNISPEVIGHISNLRFIPWRDNISKGTKCDFNYNTEYENNNSTI